MKYPPTLIPLLTALLLAPLAALHAATPSSQEISIAKQWAQSNVFPHDTKTPFSFSIGGKVSSEVMRDWKRTDGPCCAARLGQRTKEQLTAEFHQAATTVQQQQHAG